jgi:OOP family OmpA-OmpF porin
MSRLLAGVTVIGLAAVLTGCALPGGHEPEPCPAYADGVVLVIGAHANQPAPDLTPEVLCRLTETISAGHAVGLVVVDGTPSLGIPATVFDVEHSNPTVRQQKLDAAVATLAQAVQTATPDSDGADLLGGLVLASDTARAASPAISSIVAVDAGLPDTGSLVLTGPNGTLLTAEDAVPHLIAGGAVLADQFAGLDVHLWSIATTSAPQPQLTPGQRDAVCRLWEGVVAGLGGEAEVFPYPRTAAAVETEFTVVAAEADDPMPPTPGAGDLLVFGETSALAFVSNEPLLLDEPSALAELAPIAEWLAADRSRTAEIVGRTSSANPSINGWLSTARAELIAEHLVALGAAREQLTAWGAGYTANPPDVRPDGTVDPIARALNRVTEVHLG